jgi:hypothetical protein
MDNKNVKLVVIGVVGLIGLSIIWFVIKKLIWFAVIAVAGYFAYEFFFSKDKKGNQQS